MVYTAVISAVFYNSATSFYEGVSIYAPVPLDRYQPISPEAIARIGRDTYVPNLNPPFLTFLFLPLAHLEIREAFQVWGAINLLLALAASMTIYKVLEPYMEGKGSLNKTALLLLFYYPAFAAITIGQLSFLVLLLLAIGWAAARRGNNVLAGVALGLAMSLKLYVGVFLIVFLLLHRWKLLAWSLGTFAAGALMALAVFGLGAYRDYLAALGSVTWQADSWNASYLGFFIRIFGGLENTPLVQAPWLAYALGYGLALVSIGLLAWHSWRSRANSSTQRFDLLFSLGLVIMLLASPLGWMYYFPYLIIPFLTAWLAVKGMERWLAGLLIAGWVLSTIPHQVVPSAEIAPAHMFLWGGSYFYALLIFQAVLLRLLRD